MKKTSFLSFKLALHELKHGIRHFRVFAACLVLGVTIMATINTFGAIIKGSLRSEAQSLLGGDIEIRLRGMKATEEQQKLLESLGKVSSISTLRSMLHYNDQHTLVELKAIDDNYPLIGNLVLNESVSRAEALKENGIIVDPILLSQLSLKLGDIIQLGEIDFTIRATLKTEPDRVVQIFNFGPRVILSHSSLEKTKLVNPFSLAEHSYRILVQKNVTVNEEYEEKVKTTLETRFPEMGWRVRAGNDGNQSIKRFLDQLIAFITLSGLATFLISGIGIGSSVRSYLEKKSQTIAVLKIHGASRRTILEIYVILLALITLLGGISAVGISMIITSSLMPFLIPILPALEGKSPINIPATLLALWYGVLITYLFSLPSLLSAVNIRPADLFRSKTNILYFRKDSPVIVATCILIFLLLTTLLYNSNDLLFISAAIFVISFAFLLFGMCALSVRYITKNIKVRLPWLRLALRNMNRPGSTTGTVIFAIGISLTVLITLILTEANFQARINETVNEKAPSLFMIDILPEQKKELEELLLEYASKEQIMLYPMIRGRITAIAGKPVIESEIDEDIVWAVKSDRGISYSAKKPKNANIVKGKWWTENYSGEPLISVDQRFLDGMDIDIGDTLTVQILGQEITAKIANAREIDYTTFQINFAMMLSPGLIETFPNTSLSTVYLDGNLVKEAELIQKIAKKFPGVTVIRTKEIVETVQEILKNIAKSLRITVAVSLLAGILVLTSALNSTIEQRLYDTAILKILGARQRDILKTYISEWVLLALITSAIAAILGTFGAWLINLKFRAQGFYLMPEVTLSTICICIIIICLIGYLGNRRLFNLRPSGMLRNE